MRLDHFFNNPTDKQLPANLNLKRALTHDETLLLMDILKAVALIVKSKKLFIESVGKLLFIAETIFNHYRKNKLKHLNKTTVELMILKVISKDRL